MKAQLSPDIFDNYFVLYWCVVLFISLNRLYKSVYWIQQADGNADVTDGSFTEALSSDAAKQSSDRTGKTFDIKINFPHTVLVN